MEAEKVVDTFGLDKFERARGNTRHFAYKICLVSHNKYNRIEASNILVTQFVQKIYRKQKWKQT